jgi:hypothetical protein
MPDEQLYDPDRSVPEDLDFRDPEVALAYLNDPTTKALGDDISRLFRSTPAADQQRELSKYVSELEEQRAQAAADFQNLDPDAPGRPFLQQLLDTIDGNIEAAKLRMLELD